MHEKLEKWKPPEEYALEATLCHRLYCNKHWEQIFVPSKILNRNGSPKMMMGPREVKPELLEWLEHMVISYRIKLDKHKQSKIYFENEHDSMLFKLAWL